MLITIEIDTSLPSEVERLINFLERFVTSPATPAPEPMPATPAPPAPEPMPAPPAPEPTPPAPEPMPAPPAPEPMPAPPAPERDMRDVDSAGMPWDKRIHARTRATTSGGVWRQRRGVDADVVRQVEAELKGVAPPAPAPAPVVETPPPTPATPPAPAPVVETPPPTPATPPAPTPATPPAPTPDTPPTPTPPTPPAPATPPATFPEFMKWVATKDKKYTETDGLNELVSKVGLPSIGLLAVNLNYIPTLVDIIAAETK